MTRNKQSNNSQDHPPWFITFINSGRSPGSYVLKFTPSHIIDTVAGCDIHILTVAGAAPEFELNQ